MKTPTVERETATFRLPATLLERARREGAARGLAYVRSVEEALEVYFFSRLPPPMAEALEQDMKELKISRQNYFYSLLDARYRDERHFRSWLNGALLVPAEVGGGRIPTSTAPTRRPCDTAQFPSSLPWTKLPLPCARRARPSTR